jgi:CubicO group peptidase (beta-lactamase class C family)
MIKGNQRRTLVGSLLLAAAWAAPAHAADVARMEQVMQAEAAGDKFMGAVLVAKGDTVLLDKGYGDADLEWDVPNTPATRFKIGSLAKQFTAAAILLLEERGKLKLSDPIKTWWPDAPASWDKITLSNLLTQTSGIPDYTDAPDFGTTMKLRQTPQQRIATVSGKKLDFAPGEKFSYSNSSYMLLGAVVEKASGMPYAQFMQDNVFTPLGMKDSGYDDMAVVPRRAAGYARRNGTTLNATYVDVSAQHGAGALYSTTHDLLTWEKALFGGRVLSAASFKTMMTPFRDARGPGSPAKGGYGMGVYAGTDGDGRREISHTGSTPGFVSIMTAYPDDSVFVIVLGNIDSTPFADMASKLADLACDKPVILPSERKEVAVDAGVLSRYVGRYQLRPGFVIEMAAKDGALVAHPGDNPEIPLFAQSRTSFFGRSVDVQVDFQGSGDHASSMVWRINGEIWNAPRIP